MIYTYTQKHIIIEIINYNRGVSKMITGALDSKVLFVMFATY